jgi:hypothetical protein
MKVARKVLATISVLGEVDAKGRVGTSLSVSEAQKVEA